MDTAKQVVALFVLCFVVLGYVHAFDLQPTELHVKIASQADLALFSVIDEHIVHIGTDACVQRVTNGSGVFILKQIEDASLDE